MDARMVKGLEIAKTKQIFREKQGWLVQSQTANKRYFVDENFVCSCPDSEFHRATCKHAYAVRYYLAKEVETPKGVKTVKVRLTYSQAWEAYNKAQTQEITLFDQLLKDLVEEVEESVQGMGRPRIPLKAQLFCAIQKVYSQLSSRRARSLFVNAEARQQLGKAPSYNIVNQALNREDLTPILLNLLSLSASPLKAVETEFAVDSTGFRTTQFCMYADAKYGLRRQHKWVKAHACVGVKTNVITALAITDESAGDSPEFSGLVRETAEAGFDVKEITADKAYSSRKNYAVVKQLGGKAYIPFKSNATGLSRGTKAWRKAFLMFQLKQDEFMAHYHARSNVESAFASIKKKFGETLKSKNKTAQTNELLCKIIAYNVVVLIHEMYELGIEPDFCSKSASPAQEVGS